MGTALQMDGDIARVMDVMPYGHYIVGSSDANHEPNGMIADWVMQVSFQPRLLAVAFENDAHTLANIRENKWFTVNLLPGSEQGRKVAARFLQSYDGAKVAGRTDDEKARLHHKMDGTPHAVAAHGGPVLNSAMAWVECRATQFLPTGDHTLIVGEVVGGKLVDDVEALDSTYTGWNYSG
ncbi:MAG: flavin reductase [Dehalococcoidia bacterium]|nr:flavin reductase [Dehalococcoidia bacterium]